MYKHILFATDLTEDTEFLIEKVKAIRGYTNAKLSIVHIVDPMPGYSYAYVGIEDVEGRLMEEAVRSMVKLAERLNIKTEDQYVEVGVKTKITKMADRIKADLIICGSHGRHGLSLLLDSTANAILHSAKCDVLMVRLPDEE